MRKIDLAVLLLLPSIAGAAYRCVDDKGSTHVEEAPPMACANVPIVELSRSGAVIRTIATPTAPPSRGSRTDESNATAPPDRAAIDQKRRDRALLDTYASDREIEAARDRNVDILRGRVDASRLRLRQLSQRESELDRAVKAYKGSAPPRAAADLRAVREEKQSVEATLDKLDKEIEHTRIQFEADKARWVELQARR